MLSPIRNVHAPILTALPDDVSDLRFYRIWTSNSLKGIELQGFNNGNPLPISFLSLNSSCDNRTAVLNWKTEGEVSSKKFYIERSDDGNNWNIIGSVDTKRSDKIENYSYRDSASNSTPNFYRITESGINSSKVISSVIKSSCSAIEPFVVYPNPVSDFIKVSIKTTLASQVKIMLFDSKGVLIKNHESSLYAGINRFEINMHGIPAENYVLVAAWGSNKRTIKVLKSSSVI